MQIIAHEMEYRGPEVNSAPQLRGYEPRDYEQYRVMYNAGFHDMRQALGLTPVDCCDDAETLESKREHLFVLEEEGTLIGTVAIFDHEIDDLVINQAYQRRGYGRALLAFAVARLQQQGITPITLHVADWNQGALRLYQDFGFVVTKTERVR